jgi:hypothetical protein
VKHYTLREVRRKMIYLIYTCFETNHIGGSLLLDTAITEEEAQEKMEMYKERSAAFYKKYPNLDTEKRRHTYIKWDDIVSPLR